MFGLAYKEHCVWPLLDYVLTSLYGSWAMNGWGRNTVRGASSSSVRRQIARIPMQKSASYHFAWLQVASSLQGRSSVACRNYANIACSMLLFVLLPFFWTGETAAILVITVSEITVCSLANHFLPGAHGGAKLLIVQFLMFMAIPFLWLLPLRRPKFQMF